MIELANTAITIFTPADVVFKYVSNMENYKHWFPGVVDIRSANTLDHGVVGKNTWKPYRYQLETLNYSLK